jgi:hypothetical protein
MRRSRRSILLMAVLILLASSLTACIKFNVNITVNPDGSNTYGAALGLTEQAKALASSQGVGDPFEEVLQQTGQSPNIENATVTHWTDGDYEWAEAVFSLKTLDELNALLARVEMFEAFNISKRPGLLKDSYVVDGVIAQPGLDSEIPSDLDFDLTTVFDARMRITLPGKVIETNGLREGGDDSSILSWPLISDSTVHVHAVSERWNPTRFILIAGAAFLAVVAAVVFFLLAVTFMRRRSRAG